MKSNHGARLLTVSLVVLAVSPLVFADDSALVAIHALAQMNLKVRQMKTVPENVTEDYVTQVQTVANLHDPRAVPALLGAIETGDLAMQGLASLGDSALPSVISATKDKEAVRVYAALQTLNLMLEPENFQHFKNPDIAKEEIRQTLLLLQDSPDPILNKDVKEILSKISSDSPIRTDPPVTPPTQNQ